MKLRMTTDITVLCLYSFSVVWGTGNCRKQFYYLHNNVFQRRIQCIQHCRNKLVYRWSTHAEFVM